MPVDSKTNAEEVHLSQRLNRNRVPQSQPEQNQPEPQHQEAQESNGQFFYRMMRHKDPRIRKAARIFVVNLRNKAEFQKNSNEIGSSRSNPNIEHDVSKKGGYMDRYTNVVLTIIAVCLFAIVLKLYEPNNRFNNNGPTIGDLMDLKELKYEERQIEGKKIIRTIPLVKIHGG